MIEKISTLNELDRLVFEVLELAEDSKIILLRGDLASGKTTFVKKFADALGIDADVTSPTFSVQNRYGNRLYHYDIYQYGVDGFLASGLLEELDIEGYHLIEWGDESLENILKSYMIEYITVDIEKIDNNSRKYKVEKCTN